MEHTKNIELKYDHVGSVSNGVAIVSIDGKFGVVDESGQELIPCQYDDAEKFSASTMAVKLDGKWGFVRIKGL
jgi:hypothetical protein